MIRSSVVHDTIKCGSERTSDIEGSSEVDLDDLAEMIEGSSRSVSIQRRGHRADSSTMHDSSDRSVAERGVGGGNCGFDGLLRRGVTLDEERFRSNSLCDTLSRFDVEIQDSYVGSSLAE